MYSEWLTSCYISHLAYIPVQVSEIKLVDEETSWSYENIGKKKSNFYILQEE